MGNPLPAGRLIPGPAANVDGAPPAPEGTFPPNLAEGSAGGGASTDKEMMFVPRTIVRPSVRFSSDSTIAGAVLPGALDLVCFRFTRRNSSVSARTRFMCWKVSNQQVRGWGVFGGEKKYFVKGEHGAGHLSAVGEGDAHSIIDLVMIISVQAEVI